MKILPFVACVLLPLSGYSQAIDFEYLMDKERSIKRETNFDSLANGYYFLFDKYYYIDETKANDYLSKFFILSKENNDSLRISLYYAQKAMRHFYDEKYEEAIVLADSTMIYSKSSDHFYFLEAALIQIRGYNFFKRFREAIEIGRKLVQDPRFEEIPIQIAKVHFNIGQSYRGLNNDSSLFFLKKSIPYLIENPDNQVLLHIYHSLAEEYRDNSEFDSALHYAVMAVELASDTARYNELDYLLPAYNYHWILRHFGQLEKANELANEIQRKRYSAKVKSIEFPELYSKQAYFEFLRSKQMYRLILLVSLLIVVLLFLFFFIFFTKRLKTKEEELSKSLQLNEVLLLETNHRVKNNFQMILSMINISARDFDLSVQKFVEQTRAKIASMARIHEYLLESSTSGRLNSIMFLNEVLNSLKESLDLSDNNISISFETKDFTLSPKVLTILGVILNELVINSVKYAFIDKCGGSIQIKVEKQGNEVKMTFRDNGQGLGQAKLVSSSSGMSIISSLTRQIKGNLEISNNLGTVVEISFTS
jgi:two-component system, sensor histidine kinase PdtaS